MVWTCCQQAGTIDDVVRQKLCGFKNGEALSDKDKLVFSKRKLLRDVKTKVFDLSKGECFSVTGIKKKALDLTAEMIASYGVCVCVVTRVRSLSQGGGGRAPC